MRLTLDFDREFTDNLLQISRGRLDIFERTTKEFLAQVRSSSGKADDLTPEENDLQAE